MDKFLALFNEQNVLSWLKELPEYGVYGFLALSSVIENVFPPWPGDTVTVAGGVLLKFGVIGAVQTMVSLVIGNLIGATIMYFAGEAVLELARRLEAKITRPALVKGWMHELTSKENIAKAHNWFEKWGVYFVLISRFSAGIRFFVSIVAGISRMNFLLFSLFFTIGVLIWNTLLLSGGYALGNNWNDILGYLALYNKFVIGLMVLATIAFFGYKYWRKNKAEG